MVEQVWNYSFSVPCALLMLTLLAFYFSRPHLPIRMNRTFLALLAVQLLVMASDVASSLVDEHHSQFSPDTLYIMNTAFFVFYIARIFLFFLITADVIHVQRSKTFAVAAIPFLACELLSLTSCITGAVFSVQNGAYHSGPAYNSLYLCSLFYLALSIGIVVRHAKSLKRRDFVSALALNLVLFAGNIVRFLMPYLLVMNTFCMIAIAVAFFAFINPDLYLSDHVLAFNSRAFQETLVDRAAKGESHALGFALQNYSYKRSMAGGRQIDKIIELILKYLKDEYPDAIAFYLGDGRFALIAHEVGQYEEMREGIRVRFRQPWRTDSLNLSYAVAFAYASSSMNVQSAEKVAELLFASLDDARESLVYSGNQGNADTSDMLSVDRRVAILGALERAMDNNAVEVYLQPIVDSVTHEVVAAEALARIRDDDGSILPPALFVPIAEKNGYIGDLDEQMLDKVCRFSQTHDADTLNLKWINVNMSPVQCLQQDVAQRLASILQQHDVPIGRVHLEITEEAMIDYAMFEKQLTALSEQGFQLSLDDYGTGYSNLMRVIRHPFANIKLDMSLVWNYTQERDHLLPAIVRAFREMGFTVTAEGIETPEMAEALTAIGCDYLQGYLFSQPLPTAEFVERYGSRA